MLALAQAHVQATGQQRQGSLRLPQAVPEPHSSPLRRLPHALLWLESTPGHPPRTIPGGSSQLHTQLSGRRWPGKPQFVPGQRHLDGDAGLIAPEVGSHCRRNGLTWGLLGAAQSGAHVSIDVISKHGWGDDIERKAPRTCARIHTPVNAERFLEWEFAIVGQQVWIIVIHADKREM